LGLLSARSAVATTEVEEDIDSGPPWGCCRRVRQWPPPKLRMTSMAAPLGVLPAGPAAATTEVEEDVNGRPPRVVLPVVRI
jgi:hypothetical protein